MREQQARDQRGQSQQNCQSANHAQVYRSGAHVFVAVRLESMHALCAQHRRSTHRSNPRASSADLNLFDLGCVFFNMSKLQMMTAGLGVVLALTLASCNSVSTQTVNDQLPTGTQSNPPGTTPPGTTPPATEATTLSSGALAQIAPGHPTSGTAKLIKLADGSYVVRLENLSTVGGPDVHVWASEGTDLSGSGAVGASRYTDLGAIKSTNGNQNYVLALAAADVAKIKSVIIWCKTFSVAFGGASLN